MLVQRIWYWINYLQTDSFLYSHNMSDWYCVDIVRRNSVLKSLMGVKVLNAFKIRVYFMKAIHRFFSQFTGVMTHTGRGKLWRKANGDFGTRSSPPRKEQKASRWDASTSRNWAAFQRCGGSPPKRKSCTNRIAGSKGSRAVPAHVPEPFPLWERLNESWKEEQQRHLTRI